MSVQHCCIIERPAYTNAIPRFLIRLAPWTSSFGLETVVAEGMTYRDAMAMAKLLNAAHREKRKESK